MLNIALFGPPGAGKGTQSKLLLESYNLTYISTGDILRKEIANTSPLGLQAKSIIDKGGLVSDEIIVQIIEKNIVSDENAEGILFDGFPRTLVQAYILEGLLLKMNTSLSAMLSLEVPNKELMVRMLERAKTSGRSDDNEEVIKFRLQEYQNKTLPLVDFYKEKDKFFPINGVGSMDTIFNRLNKTIEQTLKKERVNIVLFGPPGSGKGTQAKNLAEKFGLVYISTGEMLRNEIAKGTDIGNEAAPYMEKGDIVPDLIAIKLIESKIKRNPNANGFIFKGYPRTIVQAYILDGLLRRQNTSVTALIELNVSTLEAIRRLSARSKTQKARSYDLNSDVIIHRLEGYETGTNRVADFYKKQDKYYYLNGKGTESEIKKEIFKLTEQVYKKIR